MGIFQSKCIKCNSTAYDLTKVSPICRGDKTYKTGINNEYHYFKPFFNEKCQCSIC